MQFKINLDIAQLEKERKEAYSKLQKTALPSTLTLLLGLLLLIIGLFARELVVLIIGGVMTLIGIILVGMQARKVKLREKDFKHLILNDLLQQVYGESLIYAPDQVIDSNLLVKTGHYQRPDRVLGEDYLEGYYKGVKFKTSDIKLQTISTDSDGNTQINTYFNGRYIVYYLERAFNSTLSIMENRWINRRKKQKSEGEMTIIETESIAFNEKFKVQSDDPQFFFYVMTPAFMEDLIEIERQTKGDITCYVKGNEFHVGLETRAPTAVFKLNKTITREDIEEMFGGMLLIAELIDDIGLDRPKFNTPNGGI